jgi:SAM-dependent methyltransferase
MTMTANDEQDRFSRERDFHDRKYSHKDTSPRHYAVSPTYHIFKKVRELLGDLAGKTVLEIGCGTGWITYELAAAGAAVIACDISPGAVTKTQALLERNGLGSRCRTFVGAVEEIDLPKGSVDIVLGFAILHHLDLDTALDKIHRLLGPGGRLVAAEPLGSNPAINLYRVLTPQFRTPDEHPLDLREFCAGNAVSWSISHREFYLTAMAPLALAYVPGGKAVYPRVAPLFHRLDRRLMRTFPSLGRYSWYTILDMVPR